MLKNTLIITILINLLTGNSYILFSPFIPYPEEDVIFQTFLISQDGSIQHEWDHDCSTASTAYLIENDILIRPCEVEYPVIDLPGTGGRIQKFDWMGELLWDYTFSSDSMQQHHDIEVLPNGNILILAWETKSQEEVIAAGKISHSGALYSDMIIEIEPAGLFSGNIIWEWYFWDHLIQDTIPELENYGNLSEHPELLDINYAGIVGDGPGPPGSGDPDFTHCNAIHYIEELDQIVITSRRANEIFIIDHSTTIDEAAGHTGGIYGQGGDFLYRWGNSENYGRGNSEDQVLFAPHSANWIQSGYFGEWNILIYNNGVNQPGDNFSSVIEIELPINPEGSYDIEPFEAFNPITPIWTFEDGSYFSQFQSGAFRLENNNTLVTVSDDNHLFEVTTAGEVIWDYVNNEGGFIARALSYEMEFTFEDINHDGYVDIFDLLILINYILETTEYSMSINNIDFNNDDIINIFDIILLIGMIIGDS